MSQILVLSDTAEQAAAALPALELLAHDVHSVGLGTSLESIRHHGPDLLLLDARAQVLQARNTARLLRTQAPELPILAVLTEGTLSAVTPKWPVDDFLLPDAGPAETEARLRLLLGARRAPAPGPAPAAELIRCGAVVVDEAGYSARIDGQPLNLTYKEFELLKFLAQNPGHVFTRAQLLSEVWGYDYYGGTRTVDVHIRRLRAKLGADHEQMITTVRNVGYSMHAPKG